MTIYNTRFGSLGFGSKHEKANHIPEIKPVDRYDQTIEKPPGKELSPIQDCEYIVVHSKEPIPK